MESNIEVFSQSSIKIKKSKIVYFDPFKIDTEYHDADYIFITHNHYDHYDVESIRKVIKDNSMIIVPKSIYDEVFSSFSNYTIYPVEPLNSYDIGIRFDTIRAYNNSKQFHPKDNNWLGYIIYLDNLSYYVMGDTDDTVDAREVKCDVLFIPIGGTYTMNKEEAIFYTNFIKPKVVIPIHYGSIVGNMSDGEYFISHLDNDIKSYLLIK